MTPQSPLPLCFIDARGGELARLGAAVAHAYGSPEAIALVFGEEKPVSDVLLAVLDEVGIMLPAVAPFDDALTSKHNCVWLGEAPVEAAIANAQVWPAALRSPDEPMFDRLVVARLLRDELGKRIRAATR
ncbi:MAG TPA: hypothetical protein PK156_33335 [Polyangium sp.]|nr:hypothetical protein [Polyangium sp.]